MSIRAKLFAVLSCFAILLVVSLIDDVGNAIVRSRYLDQAESINEAITALLRSGNAMGIERGETSGRLVRAVNQSKLAPPDLKDVRAKTDEALATAKSVLLKTKLYIGPEVPATAVVMIDGIIKRVTELRRTADDEARAPDGQLWRHWTDKSTMIVRDVRVMTHDLRGSLSAAAPTSISSGLDVTISLWQISDFLGQERVFAANRIAAGQPFTVGDLQEVARLQGRIISALAVVRSDQRYVDKSVGDGVAATTKSLAAFDKTRNFVYEAGARGNTYPITSDQWTEAVRGVIKTALAAQTVAVDNVRAHIESERDATRRVLFVALGTAVLAMLVVTVGVAFLIHGIISPLSRVTQALQALVQGRLDISMPHRRRLDEVGAIVDAVQAFRDSLVHGRRLQEQAAKSQAHTEVLRSEAMHEMADGFEFAVNAYLAKVTASAASLQETAQVMVEEARHAATRTTEVASISAESASRARSMWESAQELEAFVAQTGHRVEASVGFAKSAFEEAMQTEEVVTDLNESAKRIGSVTDLIAQVADQTNLLALNATIEAARAGAAGRGFAIVAIEVKTLAGMTARATAEISAQVAHIQISTDRVVRAIENITGRLRGISDDAIAIAASVREQSGSTKRMLTGVHETVGSLDSIGAHIGSVASVSVRTDAASQEVLRSAAQLFEQSSSLEAEIFHFVLSLRAA